MEKIIGLINAPFTPFYENGEVNYEPIEAYARMLVKNGLKGVFINGSSGEGYMLTDEERMKLAERWVEVAPEGFKVIVHVGSCCVKSSRKLAEHAQKIGDYKFRVKHCQQDDAFLQVCSGMQVLSVSRMRCFHRVGILPAKVLNTRAR